MEYYVFEKMMRILLSWKEAHVSQQSEKVSIQINTVKIMYSHNASIRRLNSSMIYNTMFIEFIFIVVD